MSKDVRPTDRFFYNENFTSKYTRIRVGVVANRAETDKERKETGDKVDETRSHQIEAAIVRIMKYVVLACDHERITLMKVNFSQATETSSAQ